MNVLRIGLLVMAIVAPGPSAAQTAASAPPFAPVAVPAPVYVSLELELEVNKPADAVWARIGRYCDIQEWFGMLCVLTSGKDGELGAVRVLNGAIIEMLVAKTPLSYTYAQPVRVGVPYNAYHGTLEVRPLTEKTSKLVYSLFWDSSVSASDEARAQEKATRITRFTGALKKMKEICESNTPRP